MWCLLWRFGLESCGAAHPAAHLSLQELQINVKALAEGLRALVERGMSKPAGQLRGSASVVRL